LHAAGWVLAANGDRSPEAVDIGEVRSRCPENLSGADLYPRFADQGLQYGPCFQGIASLWRGEGEALGEVGVPEGLLPDLAAYHLHPAVLDACGQVMAAAGGLHGNGGSARALVPVGLEELRLHGRLG